MLIYSKLHEKNHTITNTNWTNNDTSLSQFTAAFTAEIGIFLKLKIDINWKCSFTCTWCSFRLQTLNSYSLDMPVKIRRIAVLVVLFRREASDVFQEAISWDITWIFLLVIPQICCFWPFSVNLCSRSSKQTENESSFWPNSHKAPMFENRFLRLVHLCEVSKLFYLVKQWLK